MIQSNREAEVGSPESYLPDEKTAHSTYRALVVALSRSPMERMQLATVESAHS
jgi:hypothetical protein